MRLKNVAGPLLLVIPILLTITIGVFFNNFNNNGFATPAVASFNGCPTLILWNNSNPVEEICQAYNVTYTGPCQSASNGTYCSFQSASFLAPNSLYTCIFNLSWQCFVNGITGAHSGPAPQPFSFFNVPNAPIFEICGNVNGTGLSTSPTSGGYSIYQCDQIFASGHKVPANETTDWQSQYNCTAYTPIEPTGFSPQMNYVYLGCNFIPSHLIPTPVNNTYSAFLSFNYSNFGNIMQIGSGKCLGFGPNYNTCQIQGQGIIFTDHNGTSPVHDALNCLANSKAADAGSSTVSLTPECKAWIAAINQENGGSSSSLFFFGQILGLIGGVVLLLVGLGLGISGGAVTFNFSVTPNSQGTRYAQVLGFFLLVLVPIDSEFIGPYTVLAVLGIGTIVLALFTIVEFFGIFFLVAQPQAS